MSSSYPAVGPRAPRPPVPMGPPVLGRRRHGDPGAGTAVVLVVLGLLVLVAIGVVGWSVGADALPAATLMALVPLAAVLLTVRWVDRWEPEPWKALAVAFGWGASVSVLFALVFNTGAMMVLVASGASEGDASVVGAVVVAPVVEEVVKAAGVLLVLLVWPRHFDGPVDGLVYAATVAAGFAFVENILYFAQTMTASADLPGGGAAVATVFVMRAVMSPFAHLLFTACTGLALGLAARSRFRAAWVVALPLGLLVAVGLHALWNASAVLGDGSSFLGLYAGVQVPLFLAVVALVVALRRSEARIVRHRLGQYADAWWLAPVEVHMLSSMAERRRAQAWAAHRGGPAGRRAMRELQRTATRLAYARQRLALGRSDPGAAADESALLAELSAAREDLRRTLAV